MRRLQTILQRLRHLPADEGGQLLALTLIATVVGSLVISGLVAYAATSLMLTQDTRQEVLIRYTTDAGAEAVMADLSRGIDVLAPGYAVAQNGISLNGYTATVTVTEVTTNTTVASQYRYLDPGIGTLPASSLLTYTLNTAEGTDIYVNMPFTPTVATWEIGLRSGIVQAPSNCSDGALLIDSGSSSPARFVAQPAPGSGPHTLVICNTDASTSITAAPYDSEGNLNNTWVWANAFRDFAITSTVGNLSLRVNARQMPGTNINPQTVIVTSWHWQREQ